jgi:hypothetical protein
LILDRRSFRNLAFLDYLELLRFAIHHAQHHADDDERDPEESFVPGNARRK